MGMWNEGNKEGNGVHETQMGDVYEGKWKNNKKHGIGRYIWASGDIFLGEFKEDEIIKGSLTKKNGKILAIDLTRQQLI